MAYSKNRRLAEIVADANGNLSVQGIVVPTQSSTDNDTSAASTAFVHTHINALIDSAPGTMNTLNEIAAALNDDADFNTTVTNSIASKAPLANPDFTGQIQVTNSATTIQELIVTGNNTRSALSLRSKDSSGNLVDLRMHSLGDGPRGEIFTFTNHDLAFSTNNAAPQMTLDTLGRLGIKQTPSANNFTLQVKGMQTDGTDGRVAYFKGYGTQTSIGSTGPSVVIQNANNTANNFTKLSFESAGAGETVSINSHNRDHTNHYGDIAFNTRGSGGYSEKMRIEANGDVGIGTDNPLMKLDIRGGNMQIGGYGGGGDYGIVLTPSDSSSYWHIFNDAGGELVFGRNITVGSTEHMRIDQSGLVGIGNNNPQELLDAKSGDCVLKLDSTSNGSGVSWVKFADQGTVKWGIGLSKNSGNSAADFTFYEDASSGSPRLTIKDGGNVGIGTTNPNSPLHVKTTNQSIQVRNTGNDNVGLEIYRDSDGAKGASIGWGNGNANLEIKNYRNDGQSTGPYANIDFFTGGTDADNPDYNPTRRMRIQQTGQVGIGTDDPLNTLDLGVATQGRGLTWTNYSNLFSQYSNASTWISSNFYGNAGASGYKVGSTGTFGAAAIRVHGTGGGSNGGIIQFFTNAASSKTAGDAFTPTERMKINENGKVFIGTSSVVDDCLDIGHTGRDTAVNMSKASGGAVTREIIRFNGPLRLGVPTGGHHTYIYGGGTSYLEVEDSGRVLAKNTSTAAGPVYTFQGDDNTGLYSPAADTIELSTAGVRGLSVQSDSSVLVGATMGSVNATQKSGKIAGKATPNVMEWDLARSNTSYQHGDSVSGFASAYGLSYGLNGDSSANKWKLGEGPSGCTEWLWAGISAGSTGGSGGWGTGTISVDNNYSYLFVLWVKRVSSANTGTYYHGTGGVHDTSGNSLGNPYMTIASTGTLPQNVWCVDIQPIHAWHMTSNVAMGNQGLFRTDTGARLQHHSGQFSGVNIFRAGTSSNQSHNIQHRTYLYYPSANDGTELHWACPRLYRIDGSQPSAAELISGEMNAAAAGMS